MAVPLTYSEKGDLATPESKVRESRGVLGIGYKDKSQYKEAPAAVIRSEEEQAWAWSGKPWGAAEAAEPLFSACLPLRCVLC